MRKSLQERKFIVYQAVNLINGKRYVGITSRVLQRRISEHRCHAVAGRGNGNFARAIRKYGIETFKFSLLKVCSDRYDVCAEEIRLIAALRPQYNSTKGGDGQLSRPMTEAGRKRLSDFHRGKQWHKGHTHTDQVKVRMAIAAKERNHFAVYGHLGPASVARKVICLDEGLTFESASAAARHYSASKSQIIELCLKDPRRKTCKGKRFEYVEESVQ